VQHVVVLESRPGSAARSVLAVMDLLRRRGVRIPTISYRELPATPEGDSPTLGPNDATRPSILVRRIVHLLHAVRPSLSVAKKLLESNPELELLALPARTDEIGVDAALRAHSREAGSMALHIAAANGHIACIKALLEAGATSTYTSQRSTFRACNIPGLNFSPKDH
jgi:hypothetical protein